MQSKVMRTRDHRNVTNYSQKDEEMINAILFKTIEAVLVLPFRAMKICLRTRILRILLEGLLNTTCRKKLENLHFHLNLV